MSRLTILLDSSPLSVVTNPKATPAVTSCVEWLAEHMRAGSHIIIPEITDYEVRRELLRAGKIRGIRRLDSLILKVDYLPLNTSVMRAAAQLWARVRQTGKATADRHALDGDVILAAQALSLSAEEVIIATTNTKHLSRFTNAAHWSDIPL